MYITTEMYLDVKVFRELKNHTLARFLPEVILVYLVYFRCTGLATSIPKKISQQINHDIICLDRSQKGQVKENISLSPEDETFCLWKCLFLSPVTFVFTVSMLAC